MVPHSPSRPQTHDLPASATQVLALQVGTRMPGSGKALVVQAVTLLIWDMALYTFPSMTSRINYMCINKWVLVDVFQY